MRNSIYDLTFEDVVEIAKESNEVHDKYFSNKISNSQYKELIKELCCKYDIIINVYNKCCREFRWTIDCPERYLESRKAKFERSKHTYELKLRREQAKLDLLKEQMRKELIAELGL